jgi:hypothetical protein
VRHYFLGLFHGAGSVRAADDPPDMTAWLFDDDREDNVDSALPGVNTLVEMLCAGTEGRVIAYRDDDGRVVPVLEQPANTPVLEWGLPHVRQVVRETVTALIPHLDESAVGADLAPVVRHCLAAFWLDPAPAEATTWGDFPWEEETWPPYYPVAEPLTTRQVLGYLRRGRARRHASWRAGAAMRSRWPWRTLLLVRQRQHVAPLVPPVPPANDPELAED